MKILPEHYILRKNSHLLFRLGKTDGSLPLGEQAPFATVVTVPPALHHAMLPAPLTCQILDQILCKPRHLAVSYQRAKSKNFFFAPFMIPPPPLSSEGAGKIFTFIQQQERGKP